METWSEITNYRYKTGKSLNTWKLNNTLLNEQRVNLKGNKKYIDLHENENTMYKNLWIKN